MTLEDLQVVRDIRKNYDYKNYLDYVSKCIEVSEKVKEGMKLEEACEECEISIHAYSGKVNDKYLKLAEKLNELVLPQEACKLCGVPMEDFEYTLNGSIFSHFKNEVEVDTTLQKLGVREDIVKVLNESNIYTILDLLDLRNCDLLKLRGINDDMVAYIMATLYYVELRLKYSSENMSREVTVYEENGTSYVKHSKSRYIISKEKEELERKKKEIAEKKKREALYKKEAARKAAERKRVEEMFSDNSLIHESISELGMSARVFHILWRSGYKSVLDLVSMSCYELEDIYGIGKSSAEEIKEALAKNNLYLRDTKKEEGSKKKELREALKKVEHSIVLQNKY